MAVHVSGPCGHAITTEALRVSRLGSSLPPVSVYEDSQVVVEAVQLDGCMKGLSGVRHISRILNCLADWHLQRLIEMIKCPSPEQLANPLTKIILGIIFCYLSVSIVLTTKDDFRLVIPYVEFNKQASGIAPILLDSSTLIDGRIEALAEGHILDAPLVVPKFVLEELQKLCDSNDRQKRARGRRGLDLVAHMQVNTKIDLRIEDIGLDGRGVDRMLVELAMKEHMRIATGDTGLQRVANISGIVTININQIAAALQPPMFLL